MKRMRKKNFDLKEGTMIYRQNGETYEVLRYNKYYRNYECVSQDTGKLKCLAPRELVGDYIV